MYLLFCMHGWHPRKYYDMAPGEQKIVSVFVREQIQEMKETEGE